MEVDDEETHTAFETKKRLNMALYLHWENPDVPLPHRGSDAIAPRHMAKPVAKHQHKFVAHVGRVTVLFARPVCFYDSFFATV